MKKISFALAVAGALSSSSYITDPQDMPQKKFKQKNKRTSDDAKRIEQEHAERIRRIRNRRR